MIEHKKQDHKAQIIGLCGLICFMELITFSFESEKSAVIGAARTDFIGILKEIVAQLLYNRCQSDKGDKIGHSHQAVKEICKFPNCIKACNTAPEDHKSINDLIEELNNLVSLG